MTSITFHCPNKKCFKRQLQLEKMFLVDGTLIEQCPLCKTNVVLDSFCKCDICGQKATHFNHNKYWPPEYRCDLHVKCDTLRDRNGFMKDDVVFECVACKKVSRYDEALLSIENNIVKAICPGCGNVCSLERSITCDLCNKFGTHIGYYPYKTTGAFGIIKKSLHMPITTIKLEIRCDEHFTKKER